MSIHLWNVFLLWKECLYRSLGQVFCSIFHADEIAQGDGKLYGKTEAGFEYVWIIYAFQVIMGYKREKTAVDGAENQKGGDFPLSSENIQ